MSVLNELLPRFYSARLVLYYIHATITGIYLRELLKLSQILCTLNFLYFLSFLNFLVPMFYIARPMQYVFQVTTPEIYLIEVETFLDSTFSFFLSVLVFVHCVCFVSKYHLLRLLPTCRHCCFTLLLGVKFFIFFFPSKYVIFSKKTFLILPSGQTNLVSWLFVFSFAGNNYLYCY